MLQPLYHHYQLDILEWLQCGNYDLDNQDFLSQKIRKRH